MEDRVADILAERAAVESGAALALIASVLAHAGLTAVAMWAAWHHTTMQAPSVMTIKFAQTKPRVAAAPSVVAAAPAAAPAPKVVASPMQPVPKPVEASPFGKSSKRATEAPPAPVAAPAVTTTQPDVRFEGGDFPYTVYIDRMKALIGSRWFRPQIANGTTATVAFTIDRDGAIRDSHIETPSGNGTFDRAALRAVLESSPLPPLPFGYSGTHLGVHLTFR